MFSYSWYRLSLFLRSGRPLGPDITEAHFSTVEFYQGFRDGSVDWARKLERNFLSLFDFEENGTVNALEELRCVSFALMSTR